MKIVFEEDFIYTQTLLKAVLILKSCARECSFCPACKLKNFQNHTLLNSVFDFSCDKLTIYGSANNPYLETFLLKLKKLNPKVEVQIVGCDASFSTFSDFKYICIVHPQKLGSINVAPEAFLLPALGDPLELEAFCLSCRKLYPEIPLKIDLLDSGDPTAEFLSLDRLENLRAKFNI